jgi:hypothetical protein
MSVGKHVHKLRKYTYPKGGSVYFCTLPDCQFKIEVPFALGKETICNICEQPFLINKRTLSLKEPHCSNCGRIQVLDENGKKRYVRKVSNKVLGSIARETVTDLKSRLAGVVASASTDEDI